jgi:SNF family Na+-dependent transporter
MHSAFRLFGTIFVAVFLIAAITLGLAMVYVAAVAPLRTGVAIKPDEAVFSVGVLMAASTFAFYCRFPTLAAKWAMFFMAILCIWAHALTFLVVGALKGTEIQPNEYRRMFLCAVPMVVFGVVWLRALRTRDATDS